MTNQDLQQIQNLVSTSRRVLILTHKDPSIDTMAASLSLYLAISAMGKDVTVAMESQPIVAVANLVGIDRVKTSLEGKNLLITYKPYALGDFEKVTYMEDQGQTGTLNDSFKLTITPKEGFVPDPKNFNFSYTGAASNLIITVNVLEPAQLGALYDQNLLAATPIINIDNQDPNRDYGKFNLVEPEAASISEIVAFFLRAIGAKLDIDTANNLYQGILDATQHFQSPKVAAATLEAAAICLRVRQNYETEVKKAQAPQTPPVQSGQVQPNQNRIPDNWSGPKSFSGNSGV